jgi:hypothetical protein
MQKEKSSSLNLPFCSLGCLAMGQGIRFWVFLPLYPSAEGSIGAISGEPLSPEAVQESQSLRSTDR